MKTYLATLLILNCLLSFTFAVSDENICEESCQYCCRNKQCQSESACKGNYQPFIILGCVAGGLIGLFIARRVYVYYRNKAMIARGEDPKAKKGTRARWRSKRGAKSPSKEKKAKPSKERVKKERSSSKPGSVKSLKDVGEKSNRSKGDIYLQIDDGSVLSQEEIKSNKNKTDGKTSSRNELKPTSKNEILAKSDTNLNDKDRLNPYKQNKIPDMPAKGKSKDKENTKGGDKARSSSKGKATGSSSTVKKSNPGSMKDSKVGGTASAANRGRSTGREQSTTQKKTSSTGPRGGDKSRGNSAGPRKNQV